MGETERQRTREQVVFLPGLNGIRTLAAFGVMISHITLQLSGYNLNFSLFGFKDGKVAGWTLGEHGVTMFFVLSGFLITFLLMKEKEKFNKIKVRQFYIRRVLRIWPLYYLYFFIAMGIIMLSSSYSASPWIVVTYMFFAANIPFILEKTLLNLDHFWSIAVEEQFYLFWPLFFRIDEKKLMLLVSIIIGLLSIIRVTLWYFIPFSVPALFSVVNRFDCMLFGALGAMLYYRKNNLFLKIADNKVTQACALGVLLLMIVNLFSFFNSILEIFVVNVMTLIIIIGQINRKNRIVNFNNIVMDYLGKLSYGVYIIHILVLYTVITLFNWSLIENKYLMAALIYFTVIFVTVLLAHLSYNWFEKPFLKMKNRFAVIHSSGTKTFDTTVKT